MYLILVCVLLDRVLDEFFVSAHSGVELVIGGLDTKGLGETLSGKRTGEQRNWRGNRSDGPGIGLCRNNGWWWSDYKAVA